MERARRTSARERQRILRSKERSGLSVAEFARREGLNVRLLYTWRHREEGGIARRRPRKKVRRRSPPSPSLIPVEVMLPGPLGGEAGRVTVELSSGERLHVPADVAPEQIEGLLRALRRCC